MPGTFVTGGGYKYLQLGEGCCFLRFLKDAHLPDWLHDLRPMLTGWNAEFGDISGTNKVGHTCYHDDHERFAGTTYDPTSHYGAAAVFDFFESQAFTPAAIRALSQKQCALLLNLLDERGVLANAGSLENYASMKAAEDSLRLRPFPWTGTEHGGGFLALRHLNATGLAKILCT